MTIPNHLYVYIIKEEDYFDGAVILEEGGYGSWAYVILQGQVKIRKKTERGMVTIFTLKEGEIIGETNVLQNVSEKRSVSVVADGDVVLGVLDSEKIQKDFSGLSPQLRTLISTLSRRLMETNQKVIDILAK